MKLTHEGAARLGRHESRGFPVGDFEFQPEDFDGCFQNRKDHVVLTVEEASEILDYLSYLHLRGGRDSFLKDLEKCNRNLYERIKQAEDK